MSFLDKLRGKKAEQRAINAYNAALEAKYHGDWRESLKQNKLANQLRPGDEATIWNLAIAATALNDWEQAREAWQAYGLETNEGTGEVLLESGTACIRIDPKGRGEVVWGTRIDPARIRVLNVPLPESQRRYGDILLNDGAPEGTRMSNGNEYMVFEELGLWRASEYSTYEANLDVSDGVALASLKANCDAHDIAFEDWGTVRLLCDVCSRGNPGPHACSDEVAGRGRYGLAAKSEVFLRSALNTWAETNEFARVKSLRLVVVGAAT